MLGDIVVLKCGGSTLNELSAQFFVNIRSLQLAGTKPIVVHGGGPEIKAMLQKLNIESEFVNGLRKTTAEVMDVVEMVLTGVVNNELVRKLNEVGVQALGLSGSSSRLLEAEAKDFNQLGYVGEVTNVNTSLLTDLLNLGIVPVIAPIALGSEHTRYNINADSAASAVATAIGAQQLIFVTDVPGILHQDRLLEEVTEEDVQQLINEGVIYGGMIPKVEAALASLREGMEAALIVDGKQSVLTDHHQLVGTTIKKS